MVKQDDFSLAPAKHHIYARAIDVIYPVLQSTATLVADTLKQQLFPLVLGGDHSSAAGTIAGIKRAFPQKRLGVIWIDAHADIHSPYTTPSGNLHGMPLAIATGHDNVEHQINRIHPETERLWNLCKNLGRGTTPNLELTDIVYVSVRETEAAEENLIHRHQIPIITTQQLRHLGPETVARRCLDYLKHVDIIHVSFDVDSLDASICLGTGTPAPGGLWLAEAKRLNAALVQDQRVCCWEMSEINPFLDQLQTLESHSLAIFHTVLEAIGTHRLTVMPARSYFPRSSLNV